MQQPKIHSVSEPDPGGFPPLPLFRPEALESRQQRLYGDILLIRPFSLTLLAGIAIALAAGAVGFLLLGHHTQKVQVEGPLILVKISTAADSKSIGVATLLVPHRALPFLHPGEHINVRCPACTQQSLWPQPAIVKQIDPHPITFPKPAIQSTAVKPEPLHQLALLLERPLSESSEEFPVEVDVPVARESLLKWLFARPQAQQEMAK